MQDLEILLLIFFTFFLTIFNIWYTIYKFSKQTRETVTEFDFQIRRRIDLIGDLLKEIAKYAKSKKPFEKEFADIIKKVSMFSITDLGESLIKETDSVLKTAIRFAEKYPRLISSAKFKEIRSELNKIDQAIKSTYKACNSNSNILDDLMGKFPFNIIKERFFNIDKNNKKTESKKTSKENFEKDSDGFSESFKVKKAKTKVRKTSPKKVQKNPSKTENKKNNK